MRRLAEFEMESQGFVGCGTESYGLSSIKSNLEKLNSLTLFVFNSIIIWQLNLTDFKISVLAGELAVP